MKLRIWTECYRPFMMGGDVNQPIATEVEIEGNPIPLSRDVKVCVVKSPKGTTHIAEMKSGALVGTSLDQVKSDFDAGDRKIISKQIQDAVERGKTAQSMKPEEFWGLLRSNR